MELKKDCVEPVLETKFVKVYDLQYAPGKHYYNATRRDRGNIMAIKSDDMFKKALPDAVSCAVILDIEGEEPRLCLTKEYRYPAGRFLLSVPAGLVDASDENVKNPVFHTAVRELKEETGMIFDDELDEIEMINPFLFSSPGMTDEGNAFVRITLHRDRLPQMSQDGAVGAEVFDGFTLVSREEALKILREGVDEEGIFYSVYTWIALMVFVTQIW